jgi:hypothetical protein
MDSKGWNVWNNLTFKTQGYRKNFDLVTENENIITLHNGTIAIMRLSEQKSPLIVGEYGFSVWNITVADMLKINLNELIKSHKMENAYDELLKLINKNEFDIKKYAKVVFIHGLVVHPNYRKIGVTEEFFEFMYRDFYSENTAIIALVKPIQDNEIDADFYFKQKSLRVRNEDGDIKLIPAMQYYSLDKLMEKKDIESNEYRLFSVAQRCGFQRINGSHLFLFNPEIIIERIKEKKKLLNEKNK